MIQCEICGAVFSNSKKCETLNNNDILIYGCRCCKKGWNQDDVLKGKKDAISWGYLRDSKFGKHSKVRQRCIKKRSTGVHLHDLLEKLAF